MIRQKKFNIALAEKGLNNRKLASILGWSEQEVSRVKNGEKFSSKQNEVMEAIENFKKS